MPSGLEGLRNRPETGDPRGVLSSRGLVLSCRHMTDPDPDAEARRELRRHRAFATFLLALMGALTLGCYALPEGWATDLLQAAAKAGFVGGIADWFAVAALFRHPLGIPIPHTAIIPNQKERLGLALGRFVANHVITADEVSSVLGRLDVPGILARYLADPVSARPAAVALAALLPRILATVEDGRARRLASRIIPRVLGGAGAGIVVARALRTLVEGGRHQEVFGFILEQLKTLLGAQEETLRAAIRKVVAHETVQAWLWDVWSRLRLALEADAARPNGRTVVYLEGALGNLGAMLVSDPGVRARVETAAAGITSELLPAARDRLSSFIAQVVGGWDAKTITDRLELRVGKDLQYVRMNGTLVGFIVGGLLYAVLRAGFGHASF